MAPMELSQRESGYPRREDANIVLRVGPPREDRQFYPAPRRLFVAYFFAVLRQVFQLR